MPLCVGRAWGQEHLGGSPVPSAAPRRPDVCNDASMWGCLVAGLLVILLFALVPIPLWPLLLVGLVVLVVIAAALGLLRGIVGSLFGRH